MANPSVTWTFTNGTTSDASQVNTNFTNLISGMTDGSKDFSIGTLNVAGATNLNGTVTLGDSTADDLTITASLASSITVKTNATYNFGSSSSALLSLYLGNGTHTTRLLAGTVTSSWTFTFPDNAPSQTGMGLIFNTAGTGSFRYAEKFTSSQTTTYSSTGDETIIPCDGTSASFTVNLPAAANFVGKRFTIIKTDSDITKIITIDANSTEIILPSVQSSQLTYNLYTQYESVTLACNGTSWYVVGRCCNTSWTAFPSLAYGTLWTTTGTAGAYGNSGSPTVHIANWRRVGQTMLVNWEYRHSVAGTAGTGALLFNLMAGPLVDTTLKPANSTISTSAAAIDSVVGTFNGLSSVSNPQLNGYAAVFSSSQFKFYIASQSTAGSADSSGYFGGGGIVDFATTATMSLHFQIAIPISGWNA